MSFFLVVISSVYSYSADWALTGPSKSDGYININCGEFCSGSSTLTSTISSISSQCSELIISAKKLPGGGNFLVKYKDSSNTIKEFDCKASSSWLKTDFRQKNCLINDYVKEIIVEMNNVDIQYIKALCDVNLAQGSVEGLTPTDNSQLITGISSYITADWTPPSRPTFRLLTDNNNGIKLFFEKSHGMATTDKTDNVYACVDVEDGQGGTEPDGTCDWLGNADYDEGICLQAQGEEAWGNKDEDINTLIDNCCGDDTEDLGFLSGPSDDPEKFICVPDNNQFKWQHKSLTKGIIHSIDYGSYDVVSDGSWYACDTDGELGSFSSANTLDEKEIKTIEGYQYICYNYDGWDKIAECVGTETAGDNQYSAGESINASGDIYYCSYDRLWKTDLDQTNGLTCENAGFSWTGTLCCGDDPGETYNDPYVGSTLSQGFTTGGCFKETKIDTGNLLSNINIIQNGDFSSDLDHWSYDGIANPDSEQLKIDSQVTVYQDISNLLYPGKSYTLSLNVENQYDSGNPTIGIYQGNNLITSLLTITDKGSMELDETFLAPSDVSDLKLMITTGSNSNGFAFFDNIEIRFSNNKILNYNGSFYGCNVGSEQYKDSDNNNLILSSYSKTKCSVVGDYFCSPDSGWDDSSAGVDANQRNTSKQAPDFIGTESCCPSDNCWNNLTCVLSGTELSYENEVYICINGAWSNTFRQFTWDRSAQGICSSPTQCFVDPSGNSANNNNPSAFISLGNPNNPRCIEDKQFIGDHYCDNSSWTSRTKIITLQLLKFVEGTEDYTLVCEDYKLALNDYNYTQNIENYIRGDRDIQGYTCPGSPFSCVNNFCILRYKDGTDKVAMGVSLNQQINQTTYPFLPALNIPSSVCNSLVGTGQDFQRCITNNDSLWYSDKLNSVIFAADGISLDPTLSQSIIDFLKNPIKSFVSWLSGTLDISLGQDYGYAANIKDYNRIYFSKYYGKSVEGIIEEPEPGRKFLALNFSGFNSNVCSSVYKYLEKKGGASGTECKSSSNNFYIFSNQLTLLDSWVDLTSKLRLQAESTSVNYPPIAEAGPDQEISIIIPNWVRVELDGSDSFDPDGSSLAYLWQLIESPSDVSVTFISHTSESTFVEISEEGSYTFKLTVDDGTFYASDTVTVTTIQPGCNNGIIDTGEECDDGSQNLLPPEAYHGDCIDGTCLIAKCQDNFAGPDEECDIDDLKGEDCTTLGSGFTGGDLICSSACTFDTSGCIIEEEYCGDSIIQESEECDGDNLGDYTSDCSTYPGFIGGTLSCKNDCTLDISLCIEEYNPEFNCQITNECNYVEVLRLTGTTNAFAQISGQSQSYDYIFCCNSSTGTLTKSASSGQTALLSLTNTTNAMAGSSTIYPAKIYMSYEDGTGKLLNCNIQEDCDSTQDESCIIALTDDENAMLGSCTSNYAKKICCKIE